MTNPKTALFPVTLLAVAAFGVAAQGRALDEALVPVKIRLVHPGEVKALYLVIDDNLSPVAAHFIFGPDIDPKEINLRVRINTYVVLWGHPPTGMAL